MADNFLSNAISVIKGQPWKIKGKKKQLEENIAEQKAGIEESFRTRPEYTPSEFSEKYMDILTGGAEDIRTAAEKAVGIAETRAQETKIPGYDIFRERVGSVAAGYRQSAQEAGGGGISQMGMISNLFQNELKSLQDLSVENARWREKGKADLQLALGTYGQALASAAGLEATGAQEGIRTSEQQFQINELDPYYDQLNYNLAELGVSRSELEAIKNRRAQMWSALISLGGTVGKELATAGISGGLQLGGQAGLGNIGKEG